MPMVTLRNYFFLVIIESILFVIQIHDIFQIENENLKRTLKDFFLLLFTIMDTNFVAMCGLIIGQEFYCIYLMALLKINEIVIRISIIYYYKFETAIDTLYIICECMFLLLFYGKWHVLYPVILSTFNEKIGSNRSVFKAYTVRNLFYAARYNSYLISTYVVLIMFCTDGIPNYYDYILLGKIFLYTIEYYLSYDEGEKENKKKKLISIAFWCLFAAHSVTVTTIYWTQNFEDDPDKFPYYLYAIFNLFTLVTNVMDYLMYGKGLKEALEKARLNKKSRPFYKKYRTV